jgi:hypothetical protein
MILNTYMLARAKSHILSSQDWIAAKDIARLSNFSHSNVSGKQNSWAHAGHIFAVNHKGVDCFPCTG